MLAPSAKSVVDQICFISPPASRVPAVDRAWDLVLLNTFEILVNCWADSDLSLLFDARASPLLADIMAVTSALFLSITLRLKSWKSCN